jgi:hypothetical protein
MKTLPLHPTDEYPSPRSAQRWAHLRFSVVGPLLMAPPAPGGLQVELARLAQRKWRHPISGAWVAFGRSTIERWYYAAKREQRDPVKVLERKIRSDHGRHKSVSAALAERLRVQYRQHPSWSYQLHADNLKAVVATEPALGPCPSYATIKRFLQAHGLIKRPRRGPAHSPGAAVAEARFESREVRSFEIEHVNALWISIFITARCACCAPTASGRIRCFLARSTIARGCAATRSGICARARRNSATA